MTKTTLRRSVVRGVLAALAAGALPAAAQDTPDGGRQEQPDPRNPPTRQGTRGANFLQIGIGARANAMSGAAVSIIDGPVAMYWNPAGLASTDNLAIAATRQLLYTDLDITQSYAGLALPALGGVLGVSFNSLNSGSLFRTTDSIPGGNDPIAGAEFSWASTAIGLTYARRLTDRLDLGATAKYIGEGMTGANLNWVALDLGAQFRTGIYGTIIGVSLQNMGPSARASGPLLRRRVNSDDFSGQITSVDYETQETELPTLFRFSVGSDLYGRAGSVLGQGSGRHTLSTDITFNDAIDTDIQMAGGIEYGLSNIVFLRAGKRFYNDDRATGRRGMYGLSGGLGARLPLKQRALRFDYAYTSLGDLKNIQVFSFELGQ